MNKQEPISHWVEWDEANQRYSHQKTEDYVFGNAGGKLHNAKRIGDMTREELIQAIAAFNYDRDELAAAILKVASSESVAQALGLGFAYRRAKTVLERASTGGGPAPKYERNEEGVVVQVA